MSRKAAPHPGPGAPTLQASVAEMRALAHPLRLRIMETFAESPRTTKQVAELLGEPPTRLYHHVAALERVGLLRLKETRKNRGTTEKWYEVVSRRFGAESSGTARRKTPSERAARRAIAMAGLEQSRQEVIAAMHHRGGEPPLFGRLVVVASPDRISELRKRLYEMLKEFKSDVEGNDDCANGDVARWAVTLTFAPVSPRASR